MEQSRIDRINELARLSRERELTPAEKEEQAKLRREYVAAFKASLVAQLDNTYIIDENGNKTAVKDRRKNRN
jgi:uncharacterized protein YnzC (UPF0291/DUF896 family)